MKTYRAPSTRELHRRTLKSIKKVPLIRAIDRANKRYKAQSAMKGMDTL